MGGSHGSWGVAKGRPQAVWSRHGATCRTKAADGRASLHAVAVVAGESSHGRRGTTTTTTLCGTTFCTSRRMPRRLGAPSETSIPETSIPETFIPERATLNFSGRRRRAQSSLLWPMSVGAALIGLSGAHPLVPAAGGLRHVARRVGTNHVHSAGAAPPRHSFRARQGGRSHARRAVLGRAGQFMHLHAGLRRARTRP